MSDTPVATERSPSSIGGLVLLLGILSLLSLWSNGGSELVTSLLIPLLIPIAIIMVVSMLPMAGGLMRGVAKFALGAIAMLSLRGRRTRSQLSRIRFRVSAPQETSVTFDGEAGTVALGDSVVVNGYRTFGRFRGLVLTNLTTGSKYLASGLFSWVLRRFLIILIVIEAVRFFSGLS